MPDFIVKQLIKRSVAYGTTNNWIAQDNLTIAVGYRANAGEQYKVLAINGMPASQEAQESRNYSKDVARRDVPAAWNTFQRWQMFSSRNRRLSSSWPTQI